MCNLALILGLFWLTDAVILWQHPGGVVYIYIFQLGKFLLPHFHVSLRRGTLTAVAMMAAGTDTSPPCNFPRAWGSVCEGFVMQYP